MSIKTASSILSEASVKVMKVIDPPVSYQGQDFEVLRPTEQRKGCLFFPSSGVSINSFDCHI